MFLTGREASKKSRSSQTDNQAARFPVQRRPFGTWWRVHCLSRSATHNAAHWGNYHFDRSNQARQWCLSRLQTRTYRSCCMPHQSDLIRVESCGANIKPLPWSTHHKTLRRPKDRPAYPVLLVHCERMCHIVLAILGAYYCNYYRE